MNVPFQTSMNVCIPKGVATSRILLVWNLERRERVHYTAVSTRAGGDCLRVDSFNTVWDGDGLTKGRRTKG